MSCPEEQVSQETSVASSPFYASPIPSGPRVKVVYRHLEVARQKALKAADLIEEREDGLFREARTEQGLPRQPKPKMAEGIGADKIINIWTEAQLGLFLQNEKP